ncbi:ribosome maturation factor RimM, partial [Staphylococcus haemolyticus]
ITKDQMEEDVLTEHEYYFHEIIGCKVVSEEDGDVIGEIIDILQTGANDVWVVKGAKKEHYIPYIEDVVREINVEDKVITIYVMEGLL